MCIQQNPKERSPVVHENVAPLIVVLNDSKKPLLLVVLCNFLPSVLFEVFLGYSEVLLFGFHLFPLLQQCLFHLERLCFCLEVSLLICNSME